MRRILVIGALVALGISSASAQSWRYFRHEFTLGLGASNFLGDLGGSDDIGSSGLGSVKDINIGLTRPEVSLSYRYKITQYWAYRAMMSYARVKGSDEQTAEFFRSNRNLHFRSAIAELAMIGEFYFFKERTGHLYRFKGVKGLKGGFISPYIFGGVAGFYFNPKAEYTNGDWMALQPMGTEGQGIVAGSDPYSRIALAIPFGAGIKYAVNKQLTIGLEYGLRKTFTDYIDDVSTEYWYNDQIVAANGPEAGYFADPNLYNGDYTWVTNPRVIDSGEVFRPMRGNSDSNDAYMIAQFTVSYKLLKGRLDLPKF